MNPDKLASIIDQINNSSVLLFRKKTKTRRSSTPVQPIVYTSMRGWLTLNYLAIVVMCTLFGLIAYYLF